MASDLFSMFDSWTILSKSESESLEDWDRLSHVSHKLEGKNPVDISFSCAHPSHKGELVVHNLGSVEGNIHFLQGYCNPGFHVAPYHYQIIDPTLDDDQAEEMSDAVGHPCRPLLWPDDMEPFDEGDMDLGDPHPMVQSQKLEDLEDEEADAEDLTFYSGAGSYKAVPSKGLIQGEHNGHVYAWDIVKESFLAATNPDLSEKMNKVAKSVRTPNVPLSDLVKHKCASEEFSEDVYPLVKSEFPKPGSVIPVHSSEGELLYGLVKSSRIDFVDRLGVPVKLSVFGRSYESFDLAKGGNINPSVLYNFGVTYASMDESKFAEFLSSADTVEESSPSVVRGNPSEESSL